MVQTLQSILTNGQKRLSLADVTRMWKTNSGIGASSPGAAYQESAWIYSAVNAIARNVAGVPLRFTEGTAREVDLKPDHWLAQLFKRPNLLMSGSELLAATEIFLQLGGNALWVPVPGVVVNGEQQIAELYVFGRQHIKPLFRNRLMVGWEVNWGGDKERFAAEEVLHFRYFSPYDPVMGMGPLQAASTSFEQDWWSNKYNEAFFKNFAEPGAIISFPGEFNEKVMKSSRESWDARHQGFDKMKRTAVLWGGATVTELGATKRDMQFVEMKKWGREEVCAVFRVPPVEIMNVDRVSSTVESQKAQRILFGEEVISPELKMIEDRLSILLQIFNVKNVEAWFDTSEVSILQESLGVKITQAKDLLKLNIPLNAILKRLDLGFKPVPWGDVAYVSNTMIPITEAHAELPESPAEPENEPEEDEEPEEEEDDETEQEAVRRVMASKLKRVLFGLRNEILNYKDGISVPRWDRATRRLQGVVSNPSLLINKLRLWTEKASKQEIKTAFATLSNKATVFTHQKVLKGSVQSKTPKGYEKLLILFEERMEGRLRSYYKKLESEYVDAFLSQNQKATPSFNWIEADAALASITEDVMSDTILAFGKCDRI